MILETNQIYEQEFNWDDFLRNIEDFVEKNRDIDSFYEIQNSGLDVFQKISHSENVSIFLINDDFEFDLKIVKPEAGCDEINMIYEIYLDNGTIGKTIDSSKTCIYKHPVIEEKSVIIVPLFTVNATLGFVIITLNCDISDIPQILIRLISLMGSVFAGRLENLFNLKEIEATNIILEQSVAQRTADLKNNKRELNAILDSIHNGIIVAEKDSLNIIRSNPVAEVLIGLSDFELENRKINEFLDCSITQNNKIKNYESRLITDNGDTVPILRTTSFLNLSEKQFRIESFFDITDIKKAEQKLKNINELLEMKVEERTVDLKLLIRKLTEEINTRTEAERKVRDLLQKEQEVNELKSKFIAMVSHEFRTPLTVIKSSAQILENYQDDLSCEEVNTYTKRISKTIDMMTSLISNTLFVSKNERNKIKLDKNELNIFDFIEDIIYDAKLINENNDRIKCEYEIKNNIIKTDEKLLRLIIGNLLNNALKYSNTDTEVIIKISESDEDVIISVIDEGIGISEEDQKKIFDVFYRGTNVGNISGTGLGMVVILESLKLISGKLNLKSEINKGSVFSVTIPKYNK